MEEIIKFKMIPTTEIYYSDDSAWGIYSFITEDKIPEGNSYTGIFDEDKNVPFSCYMWQWIKQWVYRKNLPQGISLYREEKMLNKTISEI